MKDLSLAILVADLRLDELRAVYQVAGGVSPREAGPSWRAARRKLRAALSDPEPKDGRRRRAK